jgi:hypothetical protein
MGPILPGFVALLLQAAQKTPTITFSWSFTLGNVATLLTLTAFAWKLLRAIQRLVRVGEGILEEHREMYGWYRIVSGAIGTIETKSIVTKAELELARAQEAGKTH